MSYFLHSKRDDLYYQVSKEKRRRIKIEREYRRERVDLPSGAHSSEYELGGTRAYTMPVVFF